LLVWGGDWTWEKDFNNNDKIDKGEKVRIKSEWLQYQGFQIDGGLIIQIGIKIRM